MSEGIGIYTGYFGGGGYGTRGVGGQPSGPGGDQIMPVAYKVRNALSELRFEFARMNFEEKLNYLMARGILTLSDEQIDHILSLSGEAQKDYLRSLGFGHLLYLLYEFNLEGVYQIAKWLEEANLEQYLKLIEEAGIKDKDKQEELIVEMIKMELLSGRITPETTGDLSISQELSTMDELSDATKPILAVGSDGSYVWVTRVEKNEEGEIVEVYCIDAEGNEQSKTIEEFEDWWNERILTISLN